MVYLVCLFHFHSIALLMAFYLSLSINMTNLMQWRKQTIAKLPEEKKFSVNDLILFLTAKALNEVKECTVNDKKWSDFGQEIDEKGNNKGTFSAWLISAGTGIFGGK